MCLPAKSFKPLRFVLTLRVKSFALLGTLGVLSCKTSDMPIVRYENQASQIIGSKTKLPQKKRHHGAGDAARQKTVVGKFSTFCSQNRKNICSF